MSHTREVDSQSNSLDSVGQDKISLQRKSIKVLIIIKIALRGYYLIALI
jgi:hypothetical protein